MIIVGFPGIGKSSFAATHENFIDLDIDSVFGNNLHDHSWYGLYCNVASALSSQGYNVFVSSDREIRWSLNRTSEDVIAIVPSLQLKDQWIERLRSLSEDDSIRAKNKYSHIENHFERDVKEIMNECVCVVIDDIDDYSIEDLIRKGKVKVEIDNLLNGDLNESKLTEVKEFINKLY